MAPYRCRIGVPKAGKCWVLLDKALVGSSEAQKDAPKMPCVGLAR